MILNGLLWKQTRDHSGIFETESKYCISDSFADHEGYSISSEGFLATAVDMMVISTIMVSKLGFNRTWTENFQMFKLDLEKAEEPEVKLPTSAGLSKKQESSRKLPTSALLTMSKPLTVWIKTNFGKFLKRWEYQTTWSSFWEICMQVRKQQLELDMEQQTGSK